jgi:hypothetical protein
MNGTSRFRRGQIAGRAQARIIFEETRQARWNGKADTTIGMPDSNQHWPSDTGRQRSS